MQESGSEPTGFRSGLEFYGDSVCLKAWGGAVVLAQRLRG